jgi:tetratricopeptide (TPR) repeat protein
VYNKQGDGTWLFKGLVPKDYPWRTAELYAVQRAKIDALVNAHALFDRGNASYDSGEYHNANEYYSKSIGLIPNVPNAFYNRGNTWAALAKYDKIYAASVTTAWLSSAIDDYESAISLDPNNADAFYNSGYVWIERGEYSKAITSFNQALAVDPNHAPSYNGLAWLLASCPKWEFRDGIMALDNASKACQLTKQRNWEFTDTLAAAYAEIGDFKKAEESEAKAIKLAPNEKCKEHLRSRHATRRGEYHVGDERQIGLIRAAKTAGFDSVNAMIASVGAT